MPAGTAATPATPAAEAAPASLSLSLFSRVFYIRNPLVPEKKKKSWDSGPRETGLVDGCEQYRRRFTLPHFTLSSISFLFLYRCHRFFFFAVLV